MKLSIITINYNNLEGLKKTAASVVNQTWRDFEWIIVDGGSTDGSKGYIEQLAKSLAEGKDQPAPWHVEQFSLPGFTAKDLKVLPLEIPSKIPHPLTLISHHVSLITNRQRLLWCSEPDKGIYNAMNKGIKMASGEYLNFMNSGDCFYDPTTLNQFFVQIRDSDIYYGHKEFVAGNGSPIWVKAQSHMDLYDIAMSHLCQQAMFIKSRLLKERGFDEEYKIASDLKRWIELAMTGTMFEFVDITICKYDSTGVSAHNPKLFQKEKEEILSTTVPVCVLEMIFRNYRNEESHINKKCASILERGGLKSLFLRGILKLF